MGSIRFLLIGLLWLTSPGVWAGQTINPATGKLDSCVTLEDNDTVNRTCGTTTVSNATMTDDGDNTFTLDTSGTATTGWTDEGTTVTTTTATDNIRTPDNQWLGLGAAAGRIELDDQTTDEVNILSANVGILTSLPQSTLQVGTTEDAARSYAQLDAESTQTAADCDAAAELGRVFLDSNDATSIDQICICRRNVLNVVGWGCVTF